jgi:hypothetical protein
VNETVIYAVVWPAMGVVFLVSAALCFVSKKKMFAVSLGMTGVLLLGSWQYNRTHETTSKLQLALVSQKLVKENPDRPEESIYNVSLSGMELGVWRVNLRAADIRLTKPGTIVLVEFRKRPLTGSYISSITSLP